MADIHFVCAACEKHLIIDEAGAGMAISCPDCGKDVKVPVRASPQIRPNATVTSTRQPIVSVPPPQPPSRQSIAPQPLPTRPMKQPSATDVGTKKCPFCAEEIQAAAKKCKHCGSDLEAPHGFVASQAGLSVLFSSKVRDVLLIAVACLSLVAFFMPNAVVNIPILGRMKFSMYDLVSAFASSSPKENTRAPSVDSQQSQKEMLRSFKITEAGFGGIICFVAVLGLMVHYAVSIAWCIGRFAFGKTVEAINTIWLAAAIQFPVLLTVGSSIVLASMKKEMAQEKDNGFAAAFGAALMNSFSIEAGLIMWALFFVAICALAMPFIARKLGVTAHNK